MRVPPANRNAGLIVAVLISLAGAPACQKSSEGGVRTITAERLNDKYTVSVEAARREFDGDDLIVEGYVMRSVAMPGSDDEEGMALVGSEKGGGAGVQCWFTKHESAGFVGIAAGDFVRVKGLFSGESAPSLKFCKLVKEPSSDDG